MDKAYVAVAEDLYEWLQTTGEEYSFESGSVLLEMFRSVRPHVCHTAYWSQGVDDVNCSLGLRVNQDPTRTHCGTGGDTGSGNEWNSRVRPSRMSSSTGAVRLGEDSNSVPGFWGLGFWGVWEAASLGSHFELQKGGVFRATPMFLE